MTAINESLLSFYLGVIILFCTACISAVQRDTNEDSYSDCSQLCPCKCNRSTRVFDCNNEARTVSDLDDITDGSCGNLTDFSFFYLSDNSFQSFTNFVVRGSSLLTGKKYLRYRIGRCSLELHQNKLARVDNLRFHNCNYNIYVDFSYNSLTSLPSNISIDFNSEAYTDLYLGFRFSHNRITTVRNFINIGSYGSPLTDHQIYLRIDLSFNLIFISSFPDNFFLMTPDPVISVWGVDISMHGNRISFLESYPDVSDEVYTILHSRKLGINLDFFIYLDLEHNRLSSLPPVGSRLHGPYLILSLEGNPWNCDCHQRWIADNTSNLRQILNNSGSSQPYCQQPEIVKDRPLLSLASVEFICQPVVDRTVPTVYTSSIGGTVELTCPLVEGDPPVETIEWKVWPKASLLKSFWSVKARDNFSMVVNNIDHLSEGIYQCTADNGIKVSANLSISLSQEFARGRHLTWLNMTLLFLVVSVTFGLIGVSYKLYRFNQGDGSTCRVHNSDAGSNTIGSDNIPSAPVMFSALERVHLSHKKEQCHEERTNDEPKGDADCLYDDVSCQFEEEPTNDEGSKGDVDCLYDDVSCKSEDDKDKKDQKRDIQKYKDGKFPNLEIMSHHKTGLNSSHYTTKETTDGKGAAKSNIPDDSYYDVTDSEEYTYITEDC